MVAVCGLVISCLIGLFLATQLHSINISGVHGFVTVKDAHSISSSEIFQILKNNYPKNYFGSQYLIHSCLHKPLILFVIYFSV